MGTRCADHVTPLYPQNLARTSPTGGRSVGIVRVRTKATEFIYTFYCLTPTCFGIIEIFRQLTPKLHGNVQKNYETYCLIITKKFYSPNNILLHGIQYGSTIYNCVHAIAVTDTYTAFSHTNKQIVIAVLTAQLCISYESKFEILIFFQFIRSNIKDYSNYEVILLLSTAFIKFPIIFLFNITLYVDEIIVIFSLWICPYRSTTDNILCIT